MVAPTPEAEDVWDNVDMLLCNSIYGYAIRYDINPHAPQRISSASAHIERFSAYRKSRKGFISINQSYLVKTTDGRPYRQLKEYLSITV